MKEIQQLKDSIHLHGLHSLAQAHTRSLKAQKVIRKREQYTYTRGIEYLCRSQRRDTPKLLYCTPCPNRCVHNMTDSEDMRGMCNHYRGLSAHYSSGPSAQHEVRTTTSKFCFNSVVEILWFVRYITLWNWGSSLHKSTFLLARNAHPGILRDP